LATLKLVASLQNGHTSFKDHWLLSQYPQNIGFRLQYRDEGWIITDSQRSELKPGDKVIEIDSQPFDQFYAKSAPYIPASSERTRRNQLTSSLVLWPQQFKLTLDDGKKVRIDLANPVLTDGAEMSSRPLRYWHIASFSEPKFESEALDFIRSNINSPSLIIDLRDNSGGSTPINLIKELTQTWQIPLSAERIQHSTTEAAVSSATREEGSERWRMAKELKTALKSIPAKYQKGYGQFKGQLIVLINQGCASACEDFLLAIQARPNTILLGETTFGSTGQPFFKDFGNGMTLRVGTRRVFFGPGRPFEGQGITPDITLQPSRADLRERRDVVLSKAESLLSSDGKGVVTKR
jgi:carboxyl-terminal processing protease